MNEQVLQNAWRLHQAGRFDEAERLYQDVLRTNPNHAGALQSLGFLYVQRGALADGERILAKVVSLAPNSADALLNHGNVLFEMGRAADALAAYERALKLQPNAAVLWNNRGNALLEFHRVAEALTAFERALALDPANLQALESRAHALATMGRAEAALAAFDQVIARDPANVDAYLQKGLQLRQLKRAEEALAGLERALALDANRPDAHILRGTLLIDLKRYEDALAAFDAALARDPKDATAWSNRASALLRLKRPEDALASADKAIALEADRFDSWHNRGSALDAMQRYQEALAAYDKALALNRSNTRTWVNRGNLLVTLKRDGEALTDFAHALHIDAKDADALASGARALQNLKRFPEAIAEANKALAVDPDSTQALQVALHCRLHSCDWTGLTAETARSRAALARGLPAIAPFDWKALSSSEREHLECTRLWAEKQWPAKPPLWRGETYRHEKIRLAYLSTDFREHAVAHLVVGVFENHDKNRFETFGISFGPDDGRATRKRIMAAFGSFIDARKMTDADVTRFIRDNEIDVAIDLNGYTGDGRPGVLAMRPAPVQVNYLGYPGTMGAPYVDYIVADRIVIPDETSDCYSEKIVTLPDQYQANDINRRIGERTPTRGEAGLPASSFVFCSFNTNYKITPDVFDVWARLLKEVEGSVLWLLDDNPYSVAALKREAYARGVAPERLVFAPRRQHEEYLAQHRLADLFLDTLPYNAHTTASDALWTGLPVVTCIGSAFPGRVAASLLTAAGMPELITANLADYEALALALARDPARLADVKAKLAANRMACALFDTARITRHLESAYATMHQRAQGGLPPESFAVAPQ